MPETQAQYKARMLCYVAGREPLAALLLALTGVIGACGTPRKLPEPVWVAASALAAAPVADLVWPDTAWVSTSPEALGFSPDLVDSTIAAVSRRLPELRALLVVIGGRIAVERYFRGTQPTEAINTKSVTKSVLSALTGIALGRGILDSLDAPVAKWLADDLPEDADPRIRQLTVRHLLSMTGGFEWQENGPVTRDWMRSPNQVRFTLGSRMVAPPGRVFNYNTGASHLLAVALSRAATMGLAPYADSMLFGPIGVTRGPWGRDSQGHFEGGSELHLTPRDMARFGLLYLSHGRWKDRQVVPEAWVLESTRPQGRIDYGYLWWYLPEEWGGPAINALGYGGQLISIVPDANAVIVLASSIGDPNHPILEALRENLLPMLREPRSARRALPRAPGTTGSETGRGAGGPP
jgi:CubicO group peptidase (beta-lactamase class C family)